jgi:hypothetical protein
VGTLAQLPRVWWATDLPGYREHPTPFSTYSPFPYSGLPPIERDLDDEWRWLLAEPRVAGSLGYVAAGDPMPERAATAAELGALLGDRAPQPSRAFRAFVGDGEPRTRVRSCTASYLDLGQFAVDVAGGGSLIHFLSDQQWVLHWLLYVGTDGSEAVVVTETAFGFEADGESFDTWDPADGGLSVCAGSFSEFMYRFWIENEIWFRVSRDGRDELTEEQRRYATHYH